MRSTCLRGIVPSKQLDKDKANPWMVPRGSHKRLGGTEVVVTGLTVVSPVRVLRRLPVTSPGPPSIVGAFVVL